MNKEDGYFVPSLDLIVPINWIYFILHRDMCWIRYITSAIFFSVKFGSVPSLSSTTCSSFLPLFRTHHYLYSWQLFSHFTNDRASLFFFFSLAVFLKSFWFVTIVTYWRNQYLLLRMGCTMWDFVSWNYIALISFLLKWLLLLLPELISSNTTIPATSYFRLI